MNLDEKIAKSREVILETTERFNKDKIVIAWTGGKDSTVLLHLVKTIYRGEVPFPVLFVDTTKHFPEVYRYRDKMSKKWGLHLINSENKEVTKFIKKGVVLVKNLSKDMKKELERAEWVKDSFRVGFDVLPCCHLLKTVAIKQAVTKYGWGALMSGVRWDEGESSDSGYFTSRETVSFTVVNPILHFTWKDVWMYLHTKNVPYNPLYEEGFTSLGCSICTKVNPEGNIERVGRSRSKLTKEERARMYWLGYIRP